MKSLLKTSDVARRLGLSPAKVKQLVEQGFIHSISLDGALRFDHERLQQDLDALTRNPDYDINQIALIASKWGSGIQ